MTAYQYATLKYIIKTEVHVKEAENLSMVTFGSLLVRGWIKRSGSLLVLTAEGQEQYNSYHTGTANFRKNNTGLTNRVRSLLHLAEIQKIRKAG